ncbi:hypothetical protein ACQEVI_20050 [Promicromonospora sp. CA-289599]|uniref:hypothetical protein n=1 Tax=Promicromonospora sp. CA-289599 TaxID=3240014 RepID=UPI003D91CB81
MPEAIGPDADDYSDPAVIRAYVRHPDAPDVLRRKCLVVGSKGSGKSFFLKHQQLAHHPSAHLLKLPTDLSAVAGDLGIGGRSEQIAPARATSIRGKTAALLAATVLKQAAERNNNAVDPYIVNIFLPGHSSDISGKVDARRAGQIKRDLNRMPLEEWTHSPELDLMQDFAQGVRDLSGSPPIFLLDRGEDISAPALEVLMKLLDQSIPGITAIAARPAIQQLVPDVPNLTMQPGDHYDVVHLGTDPYGETWRSFVQDATRNYFELNDINAPGLADLTWTRNLARDSIKWAISYTHIALQTPERRDIERRRDHMKILRDTAESRARTILTNLVDIRRIVHEVRQRVPATTNGPQIAIDIQLGDFPEQLSLMGGRTRNERMIQAGLRAEAFYILPATSWHPYEVPNCVEISPLLAWDGSNKKWIE